jgi:cobyrinic acid a,c-diamide synthase
MIDIGPTAPGGSSSAPGRASALRCPGLVVAAPRSGSGKTTVVLGLLRALSRRRVAVQSMKCGPDYIDPGFHAAASGRTGCNLDGWAMRPALLDDLVERASAGSDLIICEALMGLFDGVAAPGATDDGSSAGLAARTGWPVLLVLDISGQSQSAGAVAAGFAGFRRDVHVGGVILNKVASERHLMLAERGVTAAGLPVVGALPRRADLALPERHLGLVQAEEIGGLDAILDSLADFVAEHCDLEAIRALARPASAVVAETATTATAGGAIAPPGQRIAVARDAAFSFLYPHLLSAWRSAGAEIVPFSPLADEGPDTAADVAWLPGGYPELHAGRLASNAAFLKGLRAFARRRPVHGECGGFMTLGTVLVDASGAPHAMAGLLDLETSFAARRMSLGYRRAVLLEHGLLGRKGGALRGHEFHYATLLRSAGEPLFEGEDANGTSLGPLGLRSGHVSGSFFHVIDSA